jgi:asparagine synthase (glutamine-hydrolysing)
MLPLYWLCREARRHVKVALSGEGADEVFGGYSYYDNHRSRSGLVSRLKSRFAGSTEKWQQRLIHNAEPTTPSGFPLLTDAATRGRLTGRNGSEIDAWEQSLFGWLNQSPDSLRRAAATDLATWLPDDLLVKFDRMSMAHSLEGRAPYLDPKIVELGVGLPQSQKIDGSSSKVALRRVAGRWLPKEILARPKQGFVLPMRWWLAQWFGAQGSVTDYFSARAVPGLDMAGVASLTETDLAAGVRRERLLFALVMLVEWYKSFATRKREAASRYERSATIAGH